MSRIPMLPTDQWDPEFRAACEGSGIQPDTFHWRANAILAHAPHMAKANAYWMATAMAGRKLSRRLLELVRLRLAFHSQCRSCMAMRFSSAMDEGFTEDLVCSLEKPMEAPDLTPPEKAARPNMQPQPASVCPSTATGSASQIGSIARTMSPARP